MAKVWMKATGFGTVVGKKGDIYHFNPKGSDKLARRQLVDEDDVAAVVEKGCAEKDGVASAKDEGGYVVLNDPNYIAQRSAALASDNSEHLTTESGAASSMPTTTSTAFHQDQNVLGGAHGLNVGPGADLGDLAPAAPTSASAPRRPLENASAPAPKPAAKRTTKRATAKKPAKAAAPAPVPAAPTTDDEAPAS